MSIILDLINASTDVILIRVDVDVVRDRGWRWAASEARGDSSSGAALCAWTSSIPWVGVLPTVPASTSAPMRTCLSGADRLVCWLWRRRSVSFGRLYWTQKGRR